MAEDSQLLERYYQGDNEALGKLYRKYYLELLYVARRFVPDKQYMEDVVQEVFSDFLKKKVRDRRPRGKNGQLRPAVRQVKNYFKGAVVNKCRNNRLIPKKEIISLNFETVEWLLVNTERSYHLSETERTEMCERVSQIVGLTGKRKTVFLLTCKGEKPGEIAETLQSNPQNIRSTLFTAMEKVRAKSEIIATMLLNEYYNDHIEQESPGLDKLLSYLYGELPEEERQQVARLIADDPDLAFAVEGMEMIRWDYDFADKEAHLAWALQKEKEFDRQIADLSSGSRTRTPRLRLWMYAGLVAASFAVFFWIFFQLTNVQPAPDSIVAMALAEDTHLSLFQTKAPSVPADSGSQYLQEALTHYETSHYEEARDLLIQHLNPPTHAPANARPAQYVLGLCYMRLEAWGKAIEVLEAVAADPSNHFTDQAWWQMGLAAFKAGDTALAVDYFRTFIQRINDPEDPRVIKAQTLVDLLEYM